MSKHNYNLLSDSGITDQEYVEELNLDPSLANTPAINEAIIENVYQGNISADTQGHIDEGMDPDKALKKATTDANKARATARSRVRAMQRIRGY